MSIKIQATLKQLAALAGINDYDYNKADYSIIPLVHRSLSLSGVKSDDITYKLYCEHERGCVYDLGININRK